MTIRSLLLLTLAVVATAAAAPASAQAPPPNPVDPSIADGSAQAALDKARARWKALKIRSYDYEVQRTCFCPTSSWMRIKVRGGSPSKKSVAAAKDLATIPRLHRVIQQAIDAKSHRLTVQYGARGVPTQISVDSIQYLADEEQYVSARRFKRR
jgi:hypothetical protein